MPAYEHVEQEESCQQKVQDVDGAGGGAAGAPLRQVAAEPCSGQQAGVVKYDLRRDIHL